MQTIKVLIADDSREFCSLLKTNLSQFNCAVVKMVHDGSHVYSSIIKYKPDVVFLDINMPLKNGLDILTDIRNDKLPVYVSMISAEDKLQFRQKAEERGADNYIEKPYKLEDLRRVIDHYQQQPKQQKIITAFIADDEVLMREVLKQNLEQLGCRIMAEAEDGEQVVKLLKQNVPDMLFLDIQMPKLDGLALLKKLKEDKIETFIVVVSGHGSYDNVKSAIDQGVNAFIVKPYSQKKLLDVILQFNKSQR